MDSKIIFLNGQKLFVFYDSFFERIKSVRNENAKNVFGELTSTQLQEIRKQVFKTTEIPTAKQNAKTQTPENQ